MEVRNVQEARESQAKEEECQRRTLEAMKVEWDISHKIAVLKQANDSRTSHNKPIIPIEAPKEGICPIASGAPCKNYGPAKSLMIDPTSPLSPGLQTTPWPSRFKMPMLPVYNGETNRRSLP